MTTSAQSRLLSSLALDSYRIAEIEKIMTPALAIYLDAVDSNINVTLGLVGNDANRLRPHVKTAKLAFIMRRMRERGIFNFKCATPLELLTICNAGASDVLVAYPMVGANAQRVREIAEGFSAVRVSALVESSEQIQAWRGSRVGLFIDINPGMDRTGVEQHRTDEIVRLAKEIQSSGLRFRGLHYYDGHLSKYELAERYAAAHRGYDQLMEIAGALSKAGITVEEIITAGTPAFPCTLTYEPFKRAPFIHRASPGTVIYSDTTSLAQLPAEWCYRPAAVVVSTVVSHPSPSVITCDAGHKTVSADAGVPNCFVIGWPELAPLKPSEEHLPIEIKQDIHAPLIGDTLYLVPRHVCPTVNNFDHAIIVRGGRIVAVERVTARGREAPLSFE
ncbi:MAG TPA: alanine racemase [Blastocatellia bacterium]|nr:alanine racemase [Blastocatellia bacterium]